MYPNLISQLGLPCGQYPSGSTLHPSVAFAIPVFIQRVIVAIEGGFLEVGLPRLRVRQPFLAAAERCAFVSLAMLYFFFLSTLACRLCALTFTHILLSRVGLRRLAMIYLHNFLRVPLHLLRVTCFTLYPVIRRTSI